MDYVDEYEYYLYCDDEENNYGLDYDYIYYYCDDEENNFGLDYDDVYYYSDDE